MGQRCPWTCMLGGLVDGLVVRGGRKRVAGLVLCACLTGVTVVSSWVVYLGGVWRMGRGVGRGGGGIGGGDVVLKFIS